MSRNTLTPEYEQTLREFADRLPIPAIEQPRPMTGAEVIARYPDMKQIDGKDVDPKQLYRVGTSVTATNHFRRLKKAYEEGGQPAVVKYLVPYIEFIRPE